MSDEHKSITWTIPLHVSISIGSMATPLQQVPISAILRPFATEGMFRRHPPIPTAQLPYRFSVESLSNDSFDWITALSLGLASRLAYENRTAIENTTMNMWKFEDCTFLESDDSQCYVATTPQVVLISFRGTESLGDWLADLSVASRTRPYGLVHRGFLGAFQDIEEQLRTQLRTLHGRSLVLTGHSLGGALATVAAAEWRNDFDISWIYTYGQPAVGKGKFESFMQHYADKLMRFVNDDDIVARVPPTYQHIGRLFHFASDGNLHRMESLQSKLGVAEVSMLSEAEFDQVRASLLQQRVGHRAEGVESLELPSVEGLLPSISDHNLDNYLAKLNGRQKNTTKVEY